LIHLLVRFWNPACGHIRLAGENIRNFSEAELRQSISVILQQPHMFNATLRENLLITHRLVDLYWMDHIVMLDKGRVAAQGTHKELLESNRRYAELHMRIS